MNKKEKLQKIFDRVLENDKAAEKLYDTLDHMCQSEDGDIGFVVRDIATLGGILGFAYLNMDPVYGHNDAGEDIPFWDCEDNFGHILKIDYAYDEDEVVDDSYWVGAFEDGTNQLDDVYIGVWSD